VSRKKRKKNKKRKIKKKKKIVQVRELWVQDCRDDEEIRLREGV
jgi:hypothetical protein